MSKTKEPTAFELVMTGLQQAIAHVEGKLELKTTTLEVADPPPKIDAETIVALREATKLPVRMFARIFSVGDTTVEAWEAGRRKPTKPQRRLLQLFVTEPATMCKTVGIAPIPLEGFQIIRDDSGGQRVVLMQSETMSRS